MRLRSLRLAGFKTFARQTEITFDPGVTAIVGPNGSGKSNTVDAIKWVLGERQAKDLRGRRMDEIIYSGGERRPRAAQAEVAIVIDNTDRRLSLDCDEVEIRRRLDRSGQSDYFLNGTRVRRHDLLDVLASTGLTTDSYAIVDQRDIEAIINCTPDQRRRLIEEAAQVRQVKAKRVEAVARLEELAANLVRLEDLRGEIEPRLETVRAQAAAAREAEQIARRLDLLRGSIVWEEWREARDLHRREQAQVEGLGRRLDEARTAARAAEEAYARCQQELQAMQDRRLQRQRRLSAGRLELQRAEHELAMAEERARSQAALAEAARTEHAEIAERLAALAARREEIARALVDAEQRLSEVPPPPPPPPPVDARRARETAEAVEQARRRLMACESQLAQVRSRVRFQEESLARLEASVLPAERELPAAREAAEAAQDRAREAAEAASRLARLRAELEGLESLWPAPRGHGLRRVGDVIVARPGSEAALSAALGPLLDAWAAPDEASALVAARADDRQATVVYPVGPVEAEAGSLFEQVTWEPGFEPLARRLLGHVVLGRDVTPEGIYREPGLIRAGSDPRVGLTARRQHLRQEIAALEPLAAQVRERNQEAGRARARLQELTSIVGQRRQLDQTSAQLAEAREVERREAARLPELERSLGEAEALAAEARRAVAERERSVAEHRAEVQRLELERTRWRERAGDLRRQLSALEGDLAALERGRRARIERAARAEQAAAEAEAALPALRDRVRAARAELERMEGESPDEEAQLAEAARRLVAAEEAHVKARLEVGSLENGLELHRREAERAALRMEELRARMPAGLTPEEVPGGKAREREMRHLERRLREIGPVNALAESECAELEERYSNLITQLEDIRAAREDLEQLIARLRQEEESRYEAVFGAVAVNFQDLFAELTAGGRATLRHAPGAEGPRSGVEILVQPPRKRMQSISLLSTGERALTALALVMALQEINPAPFTVMDEVDAALDDANVARFGDLLERLGRRRQLMIVTHNHMTMACASALYGIHLDESGCSHIVSVRLEDIQVRRKPPPAVQSA
ncbi:MAG TPA: AAA family ATPase [Candidatus Dormibacteraeota bacterium]|nr:AAA family ATPase [Candidatus Dormibacteraeota bacterium]